MISMWAEALIQIVQLHLPVGVWAIQTIRFHTVILLRHMAVKAKS